MSCGNIYVPQNKRGRMERISYWREFPNAAWDAFNLMFANRKNTLHLVSFLISCVQNRNKGQNSNERVPVI